MQLLTQFNRGVYRYERRLRKANATFAELEVGDKVASLEEDVAAKDALLAKYKAAQADVVAKTKGLESEVEKKEATIGKWGVHSAKQKKKLDVSEAKVRNQDRDLAAGLS